MQYIPDRVFDTAERGGYKSDVPREQWQVHALNPELFSCLGKALGWKSRQELIEINGEEDEPMLRDQWHHKADYFYHLILTGGDIEAFWEEIVPRV